MLRDEQEVLAVAAFHAPQALHDVEQLADSGLRLAQRLRNVLQRRAEGFAERGFVPVSKMMQITIFVVPDSKIIQITEVCLSPIRKCYKLQCVFAPGSNMIQITLVLLFSIRK